MELVRQPLAVPGALATFYSYKGGVGRTMALANMAVLLARPGTPVLMVDWDLDAPSLHYYFPGGAERPGVLELFEACRERLRHRFGAAPKPELASAVVDAVNWEQYVARVDDTRPLYLMHAGRFDADYAERAARFDWQALFDACPALFSTLAARLTARFSHVLVDARSGRADSAGICTTLLPTRLVLMFTPGRPQLDGLEALVARASAYRSSHEDEHRPLLVYPLPARIETADPVQRMLWRRGDVARGVPGYQPLFERALAEAYGYSRLSLEDYFSQVQLPHCRSHACGEPLPALDAEEGGNLRLLQTYRAFLHWFRDGGCPWEGMADAQPALPAEQERAPYWHPRLSRGRPPGALRADRAEPG
jgi:cellulose biosynthesis protein BcsQ